MMVVDDGGHIECLTAVRAALFDDTGLPLLVNACKNYDAAQSRSTESGLRACLSCKLTI